MVWEWGESVGGVGWGDGLLLLLVVVVGWGGLLREGGLWGKALHVCFGWWGGDEGDGWMDGVSLMSFLLFVSFEGLK